MKKTSLSIIGLVIILGFLVAGCGSSASLETASPTPTIESVSQPSETPTKVEPSLTPTATARIKVTTTPIPNTMTYAGEWTEFGNGMIRTWVRTDDVGTPLALGFQFTEEILLDLPISLRHTTTKLPSEVEVIPFHNVDFDWRPQGHSPNEYLVPHFDFRFFLISEETRTLIKDEHFDTNYIKPDPKYVPAFYAPVETTVRVDQSIGQRYWHMQSPEVNGEPFTQSFNFGFWRGQLVYFEQMITVAFLESKESFEADIEQPQEYETGGFYPTRYRIEYIVESGEFNVSLEGFVQH